MDKKAGSSARRMEASQARSSVPRGQQVAGGRPGTTARLLVITEVRLFRDGLARILTERSPHVAVDTAVPDDGLTARLGESPPSVVLVDVASIRRPVVVEQLRVAMPATRLVAFAVAEEYDDVVACAEAGAVGIVSREAPVEDLLSAIDGVLRGEVWCSPRVTALMCRHLVATAHAPSRDGEWLTGRERQVAGLIDGGLSNKEIAQRLNIGISTVKNHVHSILEKLRVKHRWQVAAAVRLPLAVGSVAVPS